MSPAPSAERRRVVLVAAVVAVAALLPFARGLLLGRSLYFRDLSLQFMPLRRFALEGLRQGQLRYWNPYTHEGEPLAPPPVSYPLDLLQLLLPDELGISWSLALHVAFAALAFLAFARDRGLPLAAAACGGLVYALGGFALSSVNLYVYVQALAWAPLVVMGLGRAASGGPKQVALAALAVGLCLSTNGVELAAQTLLIGVLLAPFGPGALPRLFASLALGTALAAFSLLPSWALVAGSARDAGFPTAVVLAHSVHPLTLVQTFVAGWHGDPAHLTGRWWGINFFTRGFPYILSLYLGAGPLCLALVGLSSRHAQRLRLACIVLLGAFVCLGKYVGLEYLLDALPLLHAVRYPTKAFFSVHFAVAALAAIGLAHLIEGGKPGWRRFAFLTAAVGAILAGAPLVPRLFPSAMRYFLAGFCPPEYDWPLREAVGAFIAQDAAAGGLVLLALSGLAALASAGRFSANGAAACSVALIAADLLRAGGGLNPSVTRDFFLLSPETARFAAELRAQGGRVFSCAVDGSRSYLEARMRRGIDHESLTFAAFLETLTPDFNVPFEVRSALSIDRTMLVPEARIASPEEATCFDFKRLLPRLRTAAVTHVLSLDALRDDSLEPLGILEPLRIAPLRIHVYALREPSRYVELLGGSVRADRLLDQPGRIELQVHAERAGSLVVREAFAPGWTATINGRAAPVVAADGRHSSVALPAGRSHVQFRYRPPRARLGTLISAVASLICVAMLFRRW